MDMREISFINGVCYYIKQIIEKMPYQPMRRDDLIGLRRLMNKLRLV